MNVSWEKAVWLAFWGNLALAAIKLITGLFGYSRLLFADGLQSSANALIAASILLGSSYGRRPGDESHPYGHGKAEFLFSGLAGLVVIIGGIYLLLVIFTNYRSEYVPQPQAIALLVAVLSIASNELMHSYILQAGRTLKSSTLIINAKNNRIDTFTSTIILISILAYMLGLSFMEKGAAIITSLFILFVGIKLFYLALEGIMDKNSSADLLGRIREIAMAFKKVKGIEDIKTRRMGQSNLINLIIRIDGKTSYAETDAIVEPLRNQIIENLESVENVTIDVLPM